MADRRQAAGGTVERTTESRTIGPVLPALLVVAGLLLVQCGDAGEDPPDDAGAAADRSSPGEDAGIPSDGSAADGPTQVDADRGPCSPAGATREIPCGRCGIASQTCEVDGRWSEPTACFDESGECMAGSVESSCGRERLCRSDCTWTDWNGERAGECEPGESMSSTEECATGESRAFLCSADCRFEPAGDCAAACARPARPSRSGADPVCIPAGPFVLGSLELPDTQPVRTIMMSDYWIDRFPVSKRRWAQCIEEGGCPPIIDELRSYFDAAEDDHLALFYVGMEQVFGFCEWDGGRLMSEFEYEKAARGPAPDARRHPWGDDDGVPCRHHRAEGCNPDLIGLSDFPDAVSPYGVRLLGTIGEMTRSLVRSDYSELPATDPDPLGEAIVGFQGRGWDWVPGDPAVPTTSVRHQDGYAIRCVY